MKIDLDRQTVSSDDGKVVITFATVIAVAEDVRGFGEDYLVDKARTLRDEINKKLRAREKFQEGVRKAKELLKEIGDDGNE